MNLRTATKIRLLLAVLLLLATTTLRGTAVSIGAKSATGCSFCENCAPSAFGCTSGGSGCDDCLYSNQFGWYECFESGDGSYIAGCVPWFPDQDL